jgi:hypothetical protein
MDKNNMSCVLKIMGENLDVDAFVAKTQMDGFDKSYKGDWTNKLKKRKREWSSAGMVISDAGYDDVKTQIKEAIEFLNRHKDNLRHIATTPEIEYATIDFGVDSTIDEDHLSQSFYLTKPLIKICAELDIEIELSLYKPDLELILERKRLEQQKE